MPVVNKPEMTEAKIEANHRNGSLSQGPVTPEGKERSRAAHLRHGLYAKAQEAAFRGLGEDPEHFDELLAGLREEFPPQGALQEQLVLRLARVLWMTERTDRSQEGAALRRARSADNERDNRLHARMMRLKMTAQTLRSLARSVSCWHYVTSREDLETMKKLHQQGVGTDMGEIALALFYELQEPGTDQNGISEEEKARRVVNSVRSMFGIGQMESDVEMLTPAGTRMVIRAQSPQEVEGPQEGEEGEEGDKDDRYPSIKEDDWKARERARKLLRNILSRQAEVCESQRKTLLQESLAGPSPFELAAESAPSPAEALLMRRMQDANMREVRRLTNMLLKLQRRKRGKEAQDVCSDEHGTHDVSEKTAA